MLKFRCFAIALLLMGPSPILIANEKEDRDDERSKAKSEKVEIPDAAKAALKKLAGKSKVQRILVLGDEIKVFEGLWQHDDETKEATVSAKGDLLELEEAVEAEDVPKTVKKAGAALKSKGVIYVKKVMTFYEVEVGSGEEEKSILVDATGRRVTLKYSEEEEEEDEEEDDEKAEVKKTSEKKSKAAKKDDEEAEDDDHPKAGKASGQKAKAAGSKKDSNQEDDDDGEEETLKSKKPAKPENDDDR